MCAQCYSVGRKAVNSKRYVDPDQLTQFPATLGGLGKAMGHSQKVVWGVQIFSWAREFNCSKLSGPGNSLYTTVHITTRMTTMCWSERVLCVLQLLRLTGLV